MKTFPKDIVLTPVNKPMLRDPNGRLWEPSQEEYARRTVATNDNCINCSAETKHMFKYCESCRRKTARENWEALTATTSDFPCSDEDNFFWSEDDLISFCEDSDINPAELLLYGCEQQQFGYLDSSYWDDQTNQDGELPTELEGLIAEFNDKLKNIPGFYYINSKVRFIYKTP